MAFASQHVYPPCSRHEEVLSLQSHTDEHFYFFSQRKKRLLDVEVPSLGSSSVRSLAGSDTERSEACHVVGFWHVLEQSLVARYGV
jgi:hypothetical protein